MIQLRGPPLLDERERVAPYHRLKFLRTIARFSASLRFHSPFHDSFRFSDVENERFRGEGSGFTMGDGGMAGMLVKSAADPTLRLRRFRILIRGGSAVLDEGFVVAFEP